MVVVFGIEELARDPGKAPAIPGVYVFRAGDGRALYVGKSRDLRSRLTSYFQPAAGRRRKVRALRRCATTVSVEATGSDFAAQLREIALVQALAPSFNRRLRRHERYLYLTVDYREPFPRFMVTAQPEAGTRVLGPFTPHASVADAVALASDAFRLRTCDDPERAGASTQCFRLQIHACSAPCLGRVKPGDYGRQFLGAVQALSGRSKLALADLIDERDWLAAAERFEEAGRRQRLIVGIRTMRRRLFINRVGRDAVIAVQPGVAAGTVQLWGIVGSMVCRELTGSHVDLTLAVDRIVASLREADSDALALVAQDQLDYRWVVYRWLRSAEGRHWSVPLGDAPKSAVVARVRDLAREAIGLFAVGT